MRYILLFLAFILFAIVSCEAQKPFGGTWEKVADNLAFPEGPAWDYDGTLYVSNCNGGWITRYSSGVVDTFLTDSDSIFQKTNGLTVGPDGYLYGCDFGIGAVLRMSEQADVEIFCSGDGDSAFNRPNDLVFDKKGNLYISDPKSYGRDIEDGRVFYINGETGEATLVADGLTFPNGIAISPRDGKLYLSESAREQVLRFTINEDGSLADKEVFIALPGGDPDGLAFDVEGNLYIPHFGGGTIYVIAPDGTIIQEQPAPGKQPSNIEFAGPDLKTVYVTEDETNAVYRTKVTIAGQPLSGH